MLFKDAQYSAASLESKSLKRWVGLRCCLLRIHQIEAFTLVSLSVCLG